MAHVGEQQTLGLVGRLRLPLGLLERFLVAHAPASFGRHGGGFENQQTDLFGPLGSHRTRAVQEQDPSEAPSTVTGKASADRRRGEDTSISMGRSGRPYSQGNDHPRLHRAAGAGSGMATAPAAR